VTQKTVNVNCVINLKGEKPAHTSSKLFTFIAVKLFMNNYILHLPTAMMMMMMMMMMKFL